MQWNVKCMTVQLRKPYCELFALNEPRWLPCASMYFFSMSRNVCVDLSSRDLFQYGYRILEYSLSRTAINCCVARDSRQCACQFQFIKFYSSILHTTLVCVCVCPKPWATSCKCTVAYCTLLCQYLQCHTFLLFHSSLRLCFICYLSQSSCYLPH